MRTHASALLQASLMTSILSTALHAQPEIGSRASLLFFPAALESPTTVISITNSFDGNDTFCPEGGRAGEIKIRITMYDSELNAEWREALLAPHQQHVFAVGEAFTMGRGFLLVEARDPGTGFPVQFDHLTGSALVVETPTQWAYEPYAFIGLPNGDRGLGADGCGRLYIDAPFTGGSLSSIDFDGSEYPQLPLETYVDRNIGSGPLFGPPVSFDGGRLYLAGGFGPSPRGQVIPHNNRGAEISSATLCFDLSGYFQEIDLGTTLTQGVIGTGGDPGEFAGISSGWLKVASKQNRGYLGVYVHGTQLGSQTMKSARPLHPSPAPFLVPAELPRF